MRIMRTAALALLACCGHGEDDRFTMLDRDFKLAPSGTDGQDFIVFGDEHAHVAISVAAPEDGDGVDVVVLRAEEKTRVEAFCAEAVKGRKELAGWTSGNAYLLRFANRNKGREVTVHAAISRDFRPYEGK